MNKKYYPYVSWHCDSNMKKKYTRVYSAFLLEKSQQRGDI